MRYEIPHFVAVGQLFMGRQEDNFGRAIALTENGTMLVVGAAHQNFNGDIPIIPGYLRTFKLESSVWVPFEHDLTPPDENHDVFGRSISMSSDGVTWQSEATDSYKHSGSRTTSGPKWGAFCMMMKVKPVEFLVFLLMSPWVLPSGTALGKR
jgi:hypothetical protein